MTNARIARRYSSRLRRPHDCCPFAANSFQYLIYCGTLLSFRFPSPHGSESASSADVIYQKPLDAPAGHRIPPPGGGMAADNDSFHWRLSGGRDFMDTAGTNPHQRQSLHRTFDPGIQNDRDEKQISGWQDRRYKIPSSILVATPKSNREKIRLKRSTGRLCASLTPRGAVRTLTAAIPSKAGR